MIEKKSRDEKLADEVKVRSGPFIIESVGCAEGEKPLPPKSPKIERDPWSDFNHELVSKIKNGELKVNPKSKELVKS